MNHNDFRETEDCQLFALLVDFFAFLASVAALLHFLRLDVAAQAFIEADIACYPRCFSRNWNAEVHEVVESVTLMLAAQTLYCVHELACEQICYYRVVSGFVILPPLLALIAQAEWVKVHFFIGRFLSNTIHLFMHSIQKEPQEFLSILLAISTKLRSHLRHSVFKICRCNASLSPRSHFCNEFIVCAWKFLLGCLFIII
jgi:hypothetical protein